MMFGVWILRDCQVWVFNQEIIVIYNKFLICQMWRLCEENFLIIILQEKSRVLMWRLCEK